MTIRFINISQTEIDKVVDDIDLSGAETKSTSYTIDTSELIVLADVDDVYLFLDLFSKYDSYLKMESWQ
jgi:hypothetical protein